MYIELLRYCRIGCRPPYRPAGNAGLITRGFSSFVTIFHVQSFGYDHPAMQIRSTAAADAGALSQREEKRRMTGFVHVHNIVRMSFAYFTAYSLHPPCQHSSHETLLILTNTTLSTLRQLRILRVSTSNGASSPPENPSSPTRRRGPVP